jgi:hypothetical protein
MLRSLAHFREEGGDADESLTSAVMLAVTAGDGHGGAAGMDRLWANGLEQQWPTGDGLTMMIGVGQTDEQVPPVVHQRDAACHQPAAFEVARLEATPAPLVLQLVEASISAKPRRCSSGSPSSARSC